MAFSYCCWKSGCNFTAANLGDRCPKCGDTEHVALIKGTVLTHQGTSWEIERRIGKGGMAITYKAINLRTGRDACIKQRLKGPDKATDDKWQRMFIREASGLRNLNHPRAPKGEDDFTQDSEDYMIMTFFHGMSLRQYRNDPNHCSGGRMDQDKVITILLQILEFLAYLHGTNQLHRDLNPNNIMILEPRFDEVVVIDMGLMRVMVISTQTRALGALTNMVTQLYASKEQVLSTMTTTNLNISPSDDLYSVACIGYFLWTGKDPDVNFAQRIDDVVNLPAAWRSVFTKALAEDWFDRYATTDEFAADLLTLLSPTAALPPTVNPSPLPSGATTVLFTPRNRPPGLVTPPPVAVPPTQVLPPVQGGQPATTGNTQPASQSPPPQPDHEITVNQFDVQLVPPDDYTAKITGTLWEDNNALANTKIVVYRTDRVSGTVLCNPPLTTNRFGKFEVDEKHTTIPRSIKQRKIELYAMDASNQCLAYKTILIKHPHETSYKPGAILMFITGVASLYGIYVFASSLNPFWAVFPLWGFLLSWNYFNAVRKGKLLPWHDNWKRVLWPIRSLIYLGCWLAALIAVLNTVNPPWNKTPPAPDASVIERQKQEEEAKKKAEVIKPEDKGLKARWVTGSIIATPQATHVPLTLILKRDGRSVTGQDVSLQIGEEKHAAKTDDLGEAKFQLTLPPNQTSLDLKLQVGELPLGERLPLLECTNVANGGITAGVAKKEEDGKLFAVTTLDGNNTPSAGCVVVKSTAVVELLYGSLDSGVTGQKFLITTNESGHAMVRLRNAQQRGTVTFELKGSTEKAGPLPVEPPATTPEPTQPQTRNVTRALTPRALVTSNHIDS